MKPWLSVMWLRKEITAFHPTGIMDIDGAPSCKSSTGATGGSEVYSDQWNVSKSTGDRWYSERRETLKPLDVWGDGKRKSCPGEKFEIDEIPSEVVCRVVVAR